MELNNQVRGFTSNITAHVIRFLPEMDLYKELLKYLKDKNIQAACILSCVGSLKRINIRTATGSNYLEIEDCFEIVSLVGNVSIERCHVHICLSDKEGKTIGGHLMREGNIIFTTAELVIGEFNSIKFQEEYCDKSGWPELKVYK